MASYGSGDGAGTSSTVPVCSCRAERLALSPRGGSRGGGDDRVPGVGGLADAEAVDGLVIGGDAEGLVDGVRVEVSGEGAPAPASGFEAAGLAEAVLRNLARYGYENPTPVQRYAMPIVMAGRNLMACAPTGSGKTTTFCLTVVSGLVAPAERVRGYRYGRRGRGSLDGVAKPRAVVLASTGKLAVQINEEAKNFCFETGLRVVVNHKGTYNELCELQRGVDLLVATPGRLVDLFERSWISLEAIKYLVMDEADRMLDMGFEAQIRKIITMINMRRKSATQTIIFSTTFPPEIQRLASDFLYECIFVSLGRVLPVPFIIEQRIKFANDDEEKRDLLINLLYQQSLGVPKLCKQPLAMVFVETKYEADSLWRFLDSRGFPAIEIHYDMTQEDKQRALKFFKSGSYPIMVANDVALRGLNIPNVPHVINYDLPKSIEDCIHRIRRTGRAREGGIATTFFTESDHPLAKDLMELMLKADMYVPGWLEDYAKRLCHGGPSYRGFRPRCVGPAASRENKHDVRYNFKVFGYWQQEHDSDVGDYLISEAFRAGDRNWRIMFYPKQADGEGGIARYRPPFFPRGASLYLCNADEGTELTVSFTLSVLQLQLDGRVLPMASKTAKVIFSAGLRQCYGFPRLVDRGILKLCIRNDVLWIRCDLTVINCIQLERGLGFGSDVLVPPPQVGTYLGRVLENGLGADVTIQVRGRAFLAHKAILAARSPVFAAMFYGGMLEKEATCIDIDMKTEVFELLLRYVYTDALPSDVRDAATLQDLLVAADMYDLKGLKHLCDWGLHASVVPETAASMLALAERHNCRDLRNVCFACLYNRLPFL